MADTARGGADALETALDEIERGLDLMPLDGWRTIDPDQLSISLSKLAEIQALLGTHLDAALRNLGQVRAS